jgi:FixJ family two-component response regulator
MLAKQPPPLVVVVEDDDMSRAALGRSLRAGGFEPALFESAETFFVSRLDRVPFCVIVDVHLTGMSGLDLQDRLRRQQREVPVIVTTADRTQAIRERAQQAGCAAFVWKPFSGETILDVLASMARPSHA